MLVGEEGNSKYPGRQVLEDVVVLGAGRGPELVEQVVDEAGGDCSLCLLVAVHLVVVGPVAVLQLPEHVLVDEVHDRALVCCGGLASLLEEVPQRLG